LSLIKDKQLFQTDFAALVIMCCNFKKVFNLILRKRKG